MDYLDIASPLLVPRASITSSSNDKNIGSTRNTNSSVSGLLSTLIPVLLIACVWIGVFLILRRKERRQYAPRTYLGSLQEHERSPPLPNSMFGWLGPFNKIPDTYVLQHNSIDAYFLLRYLKISVVICFVGCCITWPVLFPINATGGGGQKQLDIVSFSNIKDKNRYYAHTFIAWIFISFVLFMVTRESLYYINTRQAYLLSPLYASRISSRTVLFTSVPAAYTSERKIRQVFGDKLKNVWITADCKDLSKLVEERTKVAAKLEAGETKLIKLCNDARLKSQKKGSGATSNNNVDTEAGEQSGSAAARWIQPKQRPTHRLKPLIGQKVDTIEWSRSEIERLNPLIEKEQAMHVAGEAKPLAAVFVEFYNQTEAQAAYQMLAHHQPLHMAPRVIGFSPEEVVWDNLKVTWKSRTIRNILTIGAVCLTIVFWSIPVAVVGAISQLNYLETINGLTWLKFIDKLPHVLLGIITNLLPVVMLALLMALLPPYLRWMSKMAGLPTLSLIELRTQNYFFWFQVIQVFIVTTMTSAASAAVGQILKNPSSVTSLLAENLPKASNFYISYFILQGLQFSSGALVQVVGLVLAKVLGRLLDSTPRKMYNRWAILSGLKWGTIMPLIELLTVISITYSCIAPLVLGFSTIGLYLFYFAYRYNLLYVNAGAVDTKGLIYPQALQHTTIGCYLSVICLIGLFAIRTATGPLVLMIVYLILMVLYHFSMSSAITPLLYYLPRTLEAEEDSLLGNGNGNGLAGQSNGGNMQGEKDLVEEGNGHKGPDSDLGPAPHKKPSLFKKFLRPDIYTDYATMRRLVPRNIEISYDEQTEVHAYQHPAVRDPLPLIWVPRDSMGVSRQECAHTSKITPMTDEGAYFDDKGKMTWDMEGTEGRPPVYQEKVYY